MKSLLKMDFAERKSDLIRRCFIDLADGDYLIARWAYHHGLTHAFYWNAAQALEKYFKAFLLYNSRSVLRHSHDIKYLIGEAREIGGDEIVPRSIILPETSGMGKAAWHSKDIDLFIDYIVTYGSADNRYGVIGSLSMAQ